MTRSLIVLCGICSLIRPIYGAKSTVYAITTSPLIAPTSTTTFQPVSELPTAPDASFVAISPDGTTAYYPTGGTVKAVSLSTGKTVHTYQTSNDIAGPMAILPKPSQVYIATCAFGEFGCSEGFVEIFDMESEQQLAVIPTGLDLVIGLTVASNEATVYVSHQAGPCEFGCVADKARASRPSASMPYNSVTAIDVATLTVGASISPVQFTAPASPLIFGYNRAAGYLSIGGEPYCIGCPPVPSTLVSVDLATLTIGPRIPIPEGFQVSNLAIAGDGAMLAVTGSVNSVNELLLMDAMTGATIQTLAGVSAADSLAVSPHGDKVYFLDSGGVEIVNTSTGSITTELQNEPISYFLLSPDGSAIYLIFEAGQQAMSLPEGMTVPTYLNVGQTPIDTCFNECNPFNWLAVSPNGETLYVGGNSGVTAVSTTGATAPFTLVPDSYVGAVAVSADGGTLYVFSSTGNYFQIVNAATGVVENTISTPSCSYGIILGASIALDAAEGYAFVGTTCGPVVPINLTTQIAEPAIPGSYGTALAVSPGGKYVYASANYGSSVAVVNVATGKQTGTIPISPYSIVFSPNGARAWIAGAQSGVNGMCVVDTSTLEVTDFIAGASGGQIAITPDGRFVYVGGGDVISTATLEVVGQISAGPPIVIH